MVYLMIGIVLAVAVGAIFTQRSRNAQSRQDGIETGPQEAGTEGAISAEGVTKVSDAEAMIADAMASNAVTANAVTANADDSILLSPEAVKREEPAVPAAPAIPVAPQTPPTPQPPAGFGFSLEEEVIPLKPVVAAEPLSSPSALNSATYTSLAQAAGSKESPYAYGNTADDAKPKAEATLLRWSGKTGALQIGDLTIRGPVTYWSDGPSTTPEPSCIDIQLPVEYPGGENEIPPEGAVSYSEMTPLQRGVYLRWLAEGRIQPPPHVCYPLVWLFGLERRVLADRLDMGICVGEAFRLLPLVRWDTLRQGLIKFITWLSAKMWMPEEELLAFSRSLPFVPKEILNMLLLPYADTHLPLPSVVAFTLMRASSLAEEHGLEPHKPFLHSEELLASFVPKYKSKCEGGLILSKPKTSVFVAYVPTNPTLVGDKKASGGVLELPDFFKETDIFAPLIAVWKDFLKSAFPQEEPLKASDELEARPDWDSFITRLQVAEKNEAAEDGASAAAAVTDLGALGDLMNVARDGKKAEASARKKISDAARVEGFLILPDLGIAGKEYGWDEPVSLSPFPPGERLSQTYSAAALILEYACALVGRANGSVPEQDALSAMRTGLENYFPLSTEDEARLEALSQVLSAPAYPAGSTASETRMNPENIGESLKFWLQREQRAIAGGFLAGFLSEFSSAGDWIGVINESLDVEITHTQPAEAAVGAETAEEEKKEKENPQPLELGNKVTQALAPLFTD